MSTTQSNKGINITLWVIQAALAAMFLMAGFMKSTVPIEEFAKKAPWALEMPGLVRFIGISELLCGLGLLLPSLLKIKPVLTPIAAGAIILIMILAAGYHGMHSEFGPIVTNLVIALLAAFIVWGRFKKAPIEARS